METGDREGSSFNIWFPYTRGYMGVVKEGSLVAVRNFASSRESKCFSVLELTSVFPVHYALGTSPSDTDRAYPGFVVEAAKSARIDWEQETPVEQTTKIRAESISTGVQLTFNRTEPASIDRDMSLPMVGEDAYLLSDELTNEVINRGLDKVATISPGKMVLNPSVSVKISVEDMLRTHFAIFGFTGAGKSNLMSCLVQNLIASQSSIKVMFFDLLSEYTALLIDVLDSTASAYILAVDESSVPGGDATLEYLGGDASKLDAATAAITRTLLLPRQLIPSKDKFAKAIRRILQASKIRVFDPFESTFAAAELRTLVDPLVGGNMGAAAAPIRAWVDDRFPDSDDRRDVPRVRQLIAEADDFLENGIFGLGPGGVLQPTARVPLPATARGVISAIRNTLDRLTSESHLPANARLRFPELQSILNSESGPALVLVQSNRDDDLRDRAAEFINRIFDARRRQGRIGPQVVLAFDEADEFIPAQAAGTYAASKDAVTTVARRGRKFGMGIALATQRVAYLDTSILAQPHTYLISKLPRKYDREVVSNAFGIDQDMLSRTLKFTKGQWLLVSYDATGLENVPIPVQFPDSNSRILVHLDRST